MQKRLDRVSIELFAASHLTDVLRRYLSTPRGREIREEVRLDSIARTLIGKEPYDLTRETARRVLPTVWALAREQAQKAYLRPDASCLPPVEVPQDQIELSRGTVLS